MDYLYYLLHPCITAHTCIYCSLNRYKLVNSWLHCDRTRDEYPYCIKWRTLNRRTWYMEHGLSLKVFIFFHFEVNIFQILKVATNETSTLHKTTCTRIVIENYDNNYQQYNRHGFRWRFLSWPTRLNRLAINAISCF